MKFKRNIEDAELPERSTPTRFINVRSAQRIDVRPNETKLVDTGILVSVAKNDIATIVGPNVAELVLEPGDYRPLLVTLFNPTDRNIQIYVGQPIANIVLEAEEEPERVKRGRPKRKTATFVSNATMLEPDDTENITAAAIPLEPGFYPKEPCHDCP